jgi:molybdopterin synthase catalytic subunit
MSDTSINLGLLFFAYLKDITGSSHLAMNVPGGITVAQLKKVIIDKYPALEQPMHTVITAVDQEFADDQTVLEADAEVAFFPPVSGGSGPHDILKVIEDPLDINHIVAELAVPTTGAVCVFTGVVRGETQRGQMPRTTSLEYEAYVPMAERKMAQIADEIRERWPKIESIAMVQRVGMLTPQTPSVVIACAAAHRDTGIFEAARYGIDRLKEIVPVWKKEIGPEGEEWVEGTYHPGEGD